MKFCEMPRLSIHTVIGTSLIYILLDSLPSLFVQFAYGIHNANIYKPTTIMKGVDGQQLGPASRNNGDSRGWSWSHRSFQPLTWIIDSLDM